MGIKHDDRVTIADAPNDVADSVGLHRIEAELRHFCFTKLAIASSRWLSEAQAMRVRRNRCIYFDSALLGYYTVSHFIHDPMKLVRKAG